VSQSPCHDWLFWLAYADLDNVRRLRGVCPAAAKPKITGNDMAVAHGLKQGSVIVVSRGISYPIRDKEFNLKIVAEKLCGCFADGGNMDPL